ncbi:hypothetical protein GGR57DRAFT_514602 [Xylariaceae sp. FL1272]|nr:hypothetical protein GGR57DRAFT_514602 [Xylariaceae sp. FL1272]
MADAIGFVGDVLGLWSFATENFGTYDPKASVYQIRVGENGKDDPNADDSPILYGADGAIDHVEAYNDVGNLIGTGDGADFTSGATVEITAIQVDDNTQQAVTTRFFATDDAVCIAYITEQSEQEDHKYGWTGDWGYTCGLKYYHSSHVYIGDQKTPPRCTWIDADHTNDIEAAVISITWPDFVGDEDSPPTGDGKSYCGTSFQAWDGEDGTALLPMGDSVAARKVGPPKSQRTNNNLIVSHHSGQNATELCESENSLGPDFVSMEEGVYCNMETHETMPICGFLSGYKGDCLDLNDDKSVAHVAAAVDGSKKQTPHSRIIEWK